MIAAPATDAPSDLRDVLERSAARHGGRLCPRQVLGVRAGLAALARLGATPGARDLLAIVETDGCFVDGVEAATGCSVGHRTLRLVDHGKVAATFVRVAADGQGSAVRISPHLDVRARAPALVPDEPRRYHAQLAAYQAMPDALLLRVAPVEVDAALLDAMRGRAGVRVACTRCGEEVIDGREVLRDGATRCRGCAGEAYYRDSVDASRVPG